jgi:triosephosphate isomerase (TIM)
MARRTLIAGNWKMNLGPVGAEKLSMQLKSSLMDYQSLDFIVAPPFISIPAVVQKLKHTGILVAGQDLEKAVSGAFTGGISGEMLREAGATHVLVGHSERRSIFGDTDELVNQKIHAAFRAGLIPILCIGETLQQRDAGELEAVIAAQLSKGTSGLQADQISTVIIAYEPVWAIGTGRTASPEQAQQVHRFIRHWLSQNLPSYVAQQAQILYGGSVKPENARDLLGQPDIDGALVGGASLNAKDFKGIAEAIQ